MKNFFINSQSWFKAVYAFAICLSITHLNGAQQSNHAGNFVAHTANILGIFNDPFEFAGDYGSEINPIRDRVFDSVVSKVALAKNLSDKKLTDAEKKVLIDKALKQDEAHGPTLSEIVTPELITLLTKKQNSLEGFSQENLEQLLSFINKYGDQKIFNFMRNCPSDLLKLDLSLKEKAAREGKDFDLPILSSTEPLQGRTAQALKENLMNALFTPEVLRSTKPEALVRKQLNGLDQNFLKQFFNQDANNQDLYVFSTPAGQTFFYWLYSALNLHLIAQSPEFIDQVNKVKFTFARTLGNPQERARSLRKQLIAANSKVLFTQEIDAYATKELVSDKLFLPADKQNFKDGTIVLLRSDFWNPDYEIIPLDDYEGYKDGRLSVILATQQATGQKFLLASGHGHSTKSEDGRLQVEKVVTLLDRLSKTRGEDIKLLIGMDANTKTKEDVKEFKALLDKLDLTSTSLGPTTIKTRMVTVQHAKAGKVAQDEEDYLIVKKDQLALIDPTVGFSKGKPDITSQLPNINNQSDHYAVGATVVNLR